MTRFHACLAGVAAMLSACAAPAQTPPPMSGAIYIFTPDKVKFLDVPLLSFMKAISFWGLALREMIEKVGADQRVASAVPGRAA